MEDNTCKNCAGYIPRKIIKFYRHKYILMVFIGILMLISWFFISYNHYVASQELIVNNHNTFCDSLITKLEKIDLSTDSICNEHIITSLLKENHNSISSLLNMQFNKLQSEYSVLSLWASALMIIFLIFSIYSMFKVEEMQKQGHHSLEKLEDMHEKAKGISESIEAETKTQLDTIEKRANEMLSELNENISKNQKNFEQTVTEKTADFEKAIAEYSKQLADKAKTDTAAIKTLLDAISNNLSQEKNTKEQK